MEKRVYGGLLTTSPIQYPSVYNNIGASNICTILLRNRKGRWPTSWAVKGLILLLSLHGLSKDSLAKASWAVKGFSLVKPSWVVKGFSCKAFPASLSVAPPPPGGGGMILDGAYILGEESAALMEKSGYQIVIFSIRDSR